jgi:hypothetical protein
LRLHAGIRLEHRAAWLAQLRRVLPQACDDAIAVRDLFAAKPKHVGRAGELLFHGSPVILRECRNLGGNAATGRYRNAQRNPICPHVQSFLQINWRA